MQPEDEIIELFRSAKHELTESVGARPGEVWRFARPTAGFVRPKTLWQVWEKPPDNCSVALHALEETRLLAGADRALAVLWEGTLPDGYSTDLEGQLSTLITRRRLAMELYGVPEHVRKEVEAYERSTEGYYFLTRGGTVNGEPVNDLVAYIVDWSQSDERRHLVLLGDIWELISIEEEAQYRVGKMFLGDPERVKPFFNHDDRADSLARLGWIRKSAHYLDDLMDSSSGALCVPIETKNVPDITQCLVAHLSPVEAANLLRWYRDHLPGTIRALIEEIYRASDDLAALLSESELRRAWIETLAAAPLRRGEPASQNVAHAVMLFFEHLLGLGPHSVLKSVAELLNESMAVLEDASLEDFALQKAPSLMDLIARTPVPFGWFGIHHGQDRAPQFTNTLVRDYFLARKVIREVRAGRLDILTRYQFPREHVLIFLALLSPEVSAAASEDRSRALRLQIEQQAEQEVQLVLAHHLKRSVGAIRTQVETLREHLPRDHAPEAELALGRVDQELDYLTRLADRTRRLHQVPPSEIEDVPLRDIIKAVVSDLHGAMPQVACAPQIAEDLAVRGNRDSLEEIFSCILENAFHAAGFHGSNPQVRVAIIDEGATVRIDVADNGPGIRAEDRARIFDPRVTTKKGGDGQPIGTGMGLPIARKLAEAIGGRVDLDGDQAETTFFVRLVRARGAE